MDMVERNRGDRRRLAGLIAKESNLMQRDRLRSVLLVLQGRETLEVADAAGRSRRFVQRWAYTDRDGGIEAGRKRKAPGRQRRLTPEQEARLVKQGTLTSVWAVKGSQPTVVRQDGRKSIWVFGIVDPATGRSMLAPHQEANTAPMQTFLCAAAKNLGPRERAVMVLERAGWHIAKQLKWPRRITPLFLPPYSPELNPAERRWLWFPEHDWSNRVYPDGVFCRICG